MIKSRKETDMSIDEAIKLLEIEKMCVKHADVCNRKCDKCALVQNTDKLLEMYTSVCELLKQLEEYQLLEEQGRLIKLPCKVGNTLYKIIVDKYTKCSLHDKEFSLNCEYCEEKCDSKAIYVIKDFTVFDINEIIFYMKTIGKTVFLTREEAEAKLKELRGRENDSME